MDEIGKSRIRLGHWIDHNEEHLKGYIQVAEALEKEGLAEASQAIRKAIGLIEEANREFASALALLRGI